MYLVIRIKSRVSSTNFKPSLTAVIIRSEKSQFLPVNSRIQSQLSSYAITSLNSLNPPQGAFPTITITAPIKNASVPPIYNRNDGSTQKPTINNFIPHKKIGSGHSTKTSKAEASGGSGSSLISAFQIALPYSVTRQANQSEVRERRRQRMARRVRPIHLRVLLTNQAII